MLLLSIYTPIHNYSIFYISTRLLGQQSGHTEAKRSNNATSMGPEVGDIFCFHTITNASSLHYSLKSILKL